MWIFYRNEVTRANNSKLANALDWNRTRASEQTSESPYFFMVSCCLLIYFGWDLNFRIRASISYEGWALGRRDRRAGITKA